ncbi:MAG TPA: molecular chaperone TorD family protein [Symbiobacteriaceae bacterium]|nr:molecular chaperone TorD family protein [Symbiobacteriaceae bacterium]
MATRAELLIQTEDLKAVLEARAFAYRMLAQAFLAEPVKAQIQSLAETGAVGIFPYAQDSEHIQQGMDEVQAYLSDPANATDEAFDDLHWDYTRMFIGPGALPAPPWESAYSNEERLLFQEQTLAVRKVFRAYGFANPGAPAEPDDHIGLELDFMYQTSRLALEKAEQQSGADVVRICRDQLAFLQEHLLKWVSAFAGDVAASAETGFYRGMVRMLHGFLGVDRSILQELLKAA